MAAQTKVYGSCPKGHLVARKVMYPNQWVLGQPVKVWCDECRRLVGVTFKVKEDSSDDILKRR